MGEGKRGLKERLAQAYGKLSDMVTARHLGPQGRQFDKEALHEEKWITAPCWHNCGGRCLNKALVVDGVVVRQKTDDTHPDSPDYMQQRGCQRGRTQRHQCFNPDRLKYPMKCKHWAAGGGYKSLRGKDEWVRISWEEALDIIAEETRKAKEQYGNQSIFSVGWATNQTQSRALAAYGGYTAAWGTVSLGAIPVVNMHMQGCLIGGVHDTMSVRKSKLIVMWGGNPAWSSAGNPTYKFLQAKEAGAKFIFVDPFYNPSAGVLGDQWIPVKPSTDAALLIGMAYHIITNDLQDQDFLDKYVVGFDADHMPEGEDPKGNFKDYVLGTYDGIPKTPEWASAICGTPVDVIKTFAEEICQAESLSFISTFAAARTHRGEQFVQAFLTVGWMTGNVGKPGCMVGFTCKERAGDTTMVDPGLVMAGSTGLTPIENPIFKYGYPGPPPAATDWQGFVWDEAWDAIVTGQYSAGVRGKQPCDIHVILNLGDGSTLNQLPNLNRGIEAFRKVDFVATSASALTTTAKYSDIVLPITTEWERCGRINAPNHGHGATRDIIIYARQVTKPLFEAKDDMWVERELCKRWGLDPDEIFPLSAEQMLFNQLAGAQVIKEDGQGYEPLLTITQEDIERMGVEGQPQEGRIPLTELEEKGIYQVRRSEGDNYGFIAFEDYIKDPEAHPIATESGKFEIYSRGLAKHINDFGWIHLPAIAQYHAPEEGAEATKSGPYPLQMYSIHYARRAHSVYDNIPILREAFPQEVFMNPQDAKARGIENGDIVKVYNEHGAMVRPVYLTERMMTGVTMIGEGAWVELDEETGLDKAGSTNMLTGTRPSGQGVQPYNTMTVEIEKSSVELAPDYKWKPRIVG